jgi:hypothetical protein
MLTAGGAPVERFTLSVREAASGFHRNELFFHAGGAFAIQDLPAGTYEVDAETPQGTATTQVTLGEGEQKSGLALALTLRGDVEGRLVDADTGAPIPGMLLSVEGASNAALVNGDSRGSRTGEGGRFHLEGVLAGSWTLTAMSPEAAFAPLRVPLEVPERGGAVDVGTLRVSRRSEAPEP